MPVRTVERGDLLRARAALPAVTPSSRPAPPRAPSSAWASRSRPTSSSSSSPSLGRRARLRQGRRHRRALHLRAARRGAARRHRARAARAAEDPREAREEARRCASTRDGDGDVDVDDIFRLTVGKLRRAVPHRKHDDYMVGPGLGFTATSPGPWRWTLSRTATAPGPSDSLRNCLTSTYASGLLARVVLECLPATMRACARRRSSRTISLKDASRLAWRSRTRAP